MLERGANGCIDLGNELRKRIASPRSRVLIGKAFTR